MDLSERSPALRRRHPWETTRAGFFERVLREQGVVAGEVEVLDVGAGDAYFARRLAASLAPGSLVTAWDSAYSVADLASLHAEGAGRLVATAARPAGTFDVALLLDVLEHVEDDAAFLRDVAANLVRPGGALLVSVPTWPALFSDHDVALGHHRRYRPRDAASLLRAAGLTLRLHGGLFHSLLAPRASQRLVDRVREPRGARPNLSGWRHGAAVTRVVEAALGAEARASLALARGGLDLPGLSWWALCTT